MKRYWSLRFLYIVFIAFVSVFFSVNSADAHRSGCHRWHSCPSDTGSYSCGDAGHPCQYPTYPKSGGVIYPPSGYYKDCYDCPLKKVPSNAHTSGLDWSCNIGYRKVAKECIKVAISKPTSTPKPIQSSSVLLLRAEGDSTVYEIINGVKTPYRSEASFSANGRRWGMVSVVDRQTLDAYPTSGTFVSFPIGTLMRSQLHFIWRVSQGTDGTVRKWIKTSTDFTLCKFNWKNVITLPEEEIQTYSWAGANSAGTIEYPLCD